MATKSFDERVVVTDPKIIRMMEHDLNDSNFSYCRKTNTKPCTISAAEENAKKWIIK